jgi:hypothetical protein
MATRLDTLRTLLAELEQLERGGDRDALVRETRNRIAELEAAPPTRIHWDRGDALHAERRRAAAYPPIELLD